MRLPAWAALTASNDVRGRTSDRRRDGLRARVGGGAAAIVAGTLGYVVGTPVGCVVGNWLKSHLTPLTLPTLF